MSNQHIYDKAKAELRKQQQEILDTYVDRAEFLQIGKKTTICLLTCKNGCEIVGHAHVIDPRKYDIEIGARYALERAADQLEGFWAYNKHGQTSEAPDQ